MSNKLRWVLRYALGTAAMICGVVMVLYWMLILQFSNMLIADTLGFASSEVLESVGQLGPWRPATADDVKGEYRLFLPMERYIVREGYVDAYLHHIKLMVVRDKTGEFYVDTVIHLDPHWRVGWATFVVLGTSIGPIIIGWFWIVLVGRLTRIKGDDQLLPAS